MARLPAIPRKTDCVITAEITFGGALPDIRNDDVTLYFFDDDGAGTPKLENDGDVTTNGVNGMAIFTIDTTDTTLDTGVYYVEIVWVSTTYGTRLIYDGLVTLDERRSSYE